MENQEMMGHVEINVENMEEESDNLKRKREHEERRINDEKKHALSENLSVLDEKKNDKFDDGLGIYLCATDDDSIHIEMHESFLLDQKNKMTMRGRDRLLKHLEKHIVSKKEKIKHGIKDKIGDDGYYD